MNVNLYLPDDLGHDAKASELPLSQLLQEAVRNELERRSAMAKTLTGQTTYEVYLEDEEGRGYTGRITGQLIASDETRRGTLDVYLTDDERVLLHDDDKCSVLELENPVDELREELSPGVYTVAMHALGERPVVDL